MNARTSQPQTTKAPSGAFVVCGMKCRLPALEIVYPRLSSKSLAKIYVAHTDQYSQNHDSQRLGKRRFADAVLVRR
jgi:hypothetical protein